jgi:hypothetical protein
VRFTVQCDVRICSDVERRFGVVAMQSGTRQPKWDLAAAHNHNSSFAFISGEFMSSSPFRSSARASTLVLIAALGLAACGDKKPATPAAPAASQPASAPAADAAKAKADAEAAAKEKEAMETAVDAYVYGYPLVTMEYTRRVSTNVEKSEGSKAPMGQFAKLRTYPDASFKTITAPNADTLYTVVWLDVSKEPWVVGIPDLKGRYALFPMLDGWTDVFEVPGKRTTGTGAQKYAITGPGWSGTLPRASRSTSHRPAWSGCSAGSIAPVRRRTTRPSMRSRTRCLRCRCRRTANRTRRRLARSIPQRT